MIKYYFLPNKYYLFLLKHETALTIIELQYNRVRHGMSHLLEPDSTVSSNYHIDLRTIFGLFFGLNYLG